MSVSIYYSARRSTALTEQEQEAVRDVISRYSVADQVEEYLQTGYGWRGEDFCLYAPPFDSSDTILEGATKLPGHTDDAMWTAILHWCKALSEIRHILLDAVWDVHVDDDDIVWNDQQQAFDPSK
jgi:hypothetical protein